MLENDAAGFETSMRFHFGEKASMATYTPKDRTKWLRRFTKHIRKETLSLETDAIHKKRILDDLEAFDAAVKSEKGSAWQLVFHLIKIIALLLGIFDVSGSKKRGVFYTREPVIFYAETNKDINNLGEIGQIRDAKNIIRIRRKTVSDLRSKGVEWERIALVFNSSSSKLKREFSEGVSNHSRR